jgi:hypothetical protein
MVEDGAPQVEWRGVAGWFGFAAPSLRAGSAYLTRCASSGASAVVSYASQKFAFG